MQHIEAAVDGGAATGTMTPVLLAKEQGQGSTTKLHHGEGHSVNAHTLAAYVLRGESLLGSPSSDWMDTSTVRTL